MNTRRNLPRILIAEEYTLVAVAFRNLLAPDYEVVSTIGDGRSLVSAAAELTPDLVILDTDMPIMNGLDAGQQIMELLPSVKLLYVTMNEDPELEAEAFRRGASGYVVKAYAASELLVAVREVLRSGSYLSPSGAKDTPMRQQKALVHEHKLTDRQRQVLQLLAEGKRMKEVGRRLKITTRTVAFHKYRIMKALHAESDASLVQYAIRHHLIAV